MCCARCYTDVLYPMLYPMCCARFTPVCVEGRCPIFDILPLQGANVIKPSRGGTQGVVHSVHYTLG